MAKQRVMAKARGVAKAATEAAINKKIASKAKVVTKKTADKVMTKAATKAAKNSTAVVKIAPIKSLKKAHTQQEIVGASEVAARWVAPTLPRGFISSEAYMTDKQLDHFKMLLTNMKRSLASDIGNMVQEMQEEVTLFADPNDRATQESNISLELRNRDRERKLIKKVDEALERIASKEYGYCELCGVEIGLQRLEARPTATMCIDCKTMDEIREKQNGS